MRHHLTLLLATLFSASATFSQITVSGRVTSLNGVSLPGVNVIEKDKTNGTATDAVGRYNLVAMPGSILVFSMVGFESIEVMAPKDGFLNVALKEGIQIEEVVVTALGMERGVNGLAYSTTKISGEPFTKARENNVANSLAGRIAGVNVTGLATGPAGSSRVVIRGVHSISRDNQPLYVLDGLPIDNTNLGNANSFGGYDWGDGISSISPDDIESVQVLKGANAAALYGSRAVNGVILITSKKGAAGKFSVELNSNFTLDRPLVHHDWQRDYGQGWVAYKPSNQSDAFSSNWFHYGPRLDGLPTIQFDGVERPYEDAGDAFKEFYDNGRTFTNTLSFAGGAEKINFRFGFTNLNNSSIIPNSRLDRRTFSLSLHTKPAKRLTTSFNIRYIDEDVSNRSQLANSPLNVNWAIGVLPVNTPLESLKGPNGDGSSSSGSEFAFVDNPWITNPFWVINHTKNNDSKDRFIGVGELKYDLNGWFYALLRTGRDQFTSRRTEITPIGTSFLRNGAMNETNIKNMETNVDTWIGSRHIFNSGLGYDVMLGASRRDAVFEYFGARGEGFLIPGLESITNFTNTSNYYGLWRRRTNSLFTTAQFSWKSLVYLNLTGRKEWFSTLPSSDNSLFFPSAGLSFVFSELNRKPYPLSYGKWRISYAQVSGDVDPYNLQLNYNLRGSGPSGLPLGQVANTTVPDKFLHPALADEIETGVELQFFHGRLNTDITFYRQFTRKDLVTSLISTTSGYDARFVKDGEVQNLGMELMIQCTPVKKASWFWETSFNFSKNQNKVLNLGKDATSIELAKSTDQAPVAFIHNEVNYPASIIKGFEYKRDSKGNIIVDSDGIPIQGDIVVFGKGMHDFTGGWNNTIGWGSFRLDFLFDFKSGAKVFSGTNAYATLTGRHKMTLVGREGEVISSGVTETGEPGTFQNPIALISYWSKLATTIGEPFIYDAGFVKLRQATLSWQVPKEWVSKGKIKELEISLTGRNVLLLFSKVPNVDPESSFQNSNAQGLEMFSVPPVRTFGMNIRARF